MRAAVFVPVLAAALAANTGPCDAQEAEAARLQKACDRVDATACTSLGVTYEDGKGVPQDYTRAASLYQKACDGGDATGCLVIPGAMVVAGVWWFLSEVLGRDVT